EQLPPAGALHLAFDARLVAPHRCPDAKGLTRRHVFLSRAPPRTSTCVVYSGIVVNTLCTIRSQVYAQGASAFVDRVNPGTRLYNALRRPLSMYEEPRSLGGRATPQNDGAASRDRRADQHGTTSHAPVRRLQRIGMRIREEREARGWSQARLATDAR